MLSPKWLPKDSLPVCWLLVQVFKGIGMAAKFASKLGKKIKNKAASAAVSYTSLGCLVLCYIKFSASNICMRKLGDVESTWAILCCAVLLWGAYLLDSSHDDPPHPLHHILYSFHRMLALALLAGMMAALPTTRPPTAPPEVVLVVVLVVSAPLVTRAR